MNGTSKQFLAATVLALGVLALPTLWAADGADPAASASGAWVADFRGKPPFKRRFISSEETAELSRFEEAASEPTTDSVTVVTYRGRPPFKREVVSTDELAELARFEETASAGEDREARRGPPGKPGSRR